MTARTRSTQTRRPAVPRTSAAAAAAAAEVAEDAAVAAPRIRSMRMPSCIALLQRQAVGRLAYSFHDRVDITPIHYVYADNWLFARTSHGAKMSTIRHVPWVAFEVDEIEGVFDWRSVVVHGTVYTMERNGSPVESRLWNTGVTLLQRIVRGTGTDQDPVPFRDLVFGIHIDQMTGRQSSSAGGTRRAAARAPVWPSASGT